MSKKAAVILADGFEEGESLFVVDIIRRGEIMCDMITLDEKMVRGAHDIYVQTNRHIDEVNVDDYDMLILPGGQPGADHMRDDDRVIALVQEFAKKPEKYIAAICAAPQVLKRADVVRGRRLTSYPNDKYRNLFTDSLYVDDNQEMEELVVVDDHLITSRGPASTLSFAYKLVEVLGGPSERLKEMMQYNAFKQSVR